MKAGNIAPHVELSVIMEEKMKYLQFLFFIIQYEPCPHDTPHYNTDLDITRLYCGSQNFTMEFHKGIIGNDQ